MVLNAADNLYCITSIMTKSIDPNDLAAINRALSTKNANDPIWIAIVVRIQELAVIVGKAVEAAPEMPATVDVPRPETAIDKIALALFRGELAEIENAPELRVVTNRLQ
jgi:hypothetical protein